MDKQYTKATIEKVEGKMLAVASEELKDRQGDVISIDGWDLKNFKKNPQLLWYHNLSSERTLPIGRATSIGYKMIDGKKKLVFEPEFETITEFGRTVKRFFEEGYLNSFSVGFQPKEFEEGEAGYKFLKQELLEISAVPVPALPTAQIIDNTSKEGLNQVAVKAILGDKKAMEKMVSDGDKELHGGDLNKGTEEKGAVPFASYPKADEGRSWDAGAAVSRIKKWASNDKGEIDFGKFKKAFAWVDESAVDKIGSYKLPHHDVQGNELITVWRGVAAAMAVLMGSRGGVDIPDDNKKAVYNHLSKHYKEFEKEAPEFRFVEDEVLKKLDKEIEISEENYAFEKIYRTLSKLVEEAKKPKIVSEVKQPVKVDTTLLLKGFVLLYQKLQVSKLKGVK